MAGLWHGSYQQYKDLNGNLLAGARAYFYSADSLSPITVYQDYGLNTAHPNPVEANAYGIFPAVFLDEEDNFYRQRITTSSGVIIPGMDVATLPIIGPSTGSGDSVTTVDSTALRITGDPFWVMFSGTRSGAVRLNGRTIGSASSGASERANADCEALYLYNWANFSNTLCPVTGGRGLTAAADWAANKPLQLINMRNKGPFGLDDMGNTAANGFTGITFTAGNATTPGSTAGAATVTITTNELPNITPAGSIALSGSKSFSNLARTSGTGVSDAGGLTGAISTSITVDLSDSPFAAAFTGTPFGGGGALNKMPPFALGTWYQKL